MYLQRLHVRNFRNIEETDIHPGPGFNVLWGDNAQGKTNFLEAVHLLGTLRSFRGSRNEEIIRHDTGESLLSGEIIANNVKRRIELVLNRDGKHPRVDGKDVKTALHFMGCLRPVLFSPEEVGLIKGPPAGRRMLLDRAVFQADPKYLERAQLFDRCLRHRNRLLKEGKSDEEVSPWTEQLIDAGARIRSERQQYLARLVPLLRETYKNIAGGCEEADLCYPAESGDEDFLRHSLRSDLRKKCERERVLGQTLAGPHRDDPLFLVDGRPLRLFGSQGQQRSYMLAFKTAQIMDLEKRMGEPPVLLLDDMTGELDRYRQGFFFRFLLERRGQVFITTTDRRQLEREGIKEARIYRVVNGKIGEDSRE